MDNRLIFLYYDMTEMWGHGRIMKAGNGKTGSSTKLYLIGKSVRNRRSVTRSEIYSSEVHESMPSRKAAIVHVVPVP